MTDVQVKKLPIAGLEYVFVPPGLPLITKAPHIPATTSILIRGGAGTGKTTLAVALAHAISREHDGVTLYLTTEFVVTELAYKAATLNLPERSVDSWRSTETHQPGAILAEHLLQTRAGASEARVVTVAARKRAAIDAVWELLADMDGAPSAERPGGPPVRAVVIDAFGLPEVEHDDNALRSDLLGLVQSLESIGITVILVEEADGRAEAWLPFVVDVVFEIDLWPDPETGDLLRRLKCPKSRYGQGLPGPHDYGLGSAGVPAVWPDLVFSNVAGTLWRPDGLAPPIFFPLDDGEYVVCDAGSVLVSTHAKVSSVFVGFANVPGSLLAFVQCGPLSRAGVDADELVQVGESHGLLALAWELIGAFNEGQINSVLFDGIGFFLTRNRARARALRTIAMLSEAGLSVCLHDDSVSLQSARGIADFVEGGPMRGSVRRAVPSLQLCRADRWLQAFGEVSECGPHSPSSQGDRLLVQHMLEGWSPEDIETQIGESQLGLQATLDRALIYHLLGRASLAERWLSKIQGASGPAILARATFLFNVGDGLAAARECLSAFDEDHVGMAEIWFGLSAIYAQNATAIEDLAETASPSHVQETVALMRALAAGRDSERLATLIESCSAWFNLPKWYVARLQAEYHLDSLDSNHWPSAIPGLSELTEDPTIPPIHRAEILHNLGVAKARTGDEPGARDAYQRAQGLNPLLEITPNATMQ